ncbi:hypothetical protein [Phenylobacterium sp.]|uniref:hypothetical protein n=1 Tax=Phenylobacterium sp. TaxID=1871053 RepID=UPI0027322D0E|nr:hypothetical protein [Phenylobacterium sp.]MDP3856007.1 hypothetical protein [Phenylobacterium sp.]
MPPPDSALDAVMIARARRLLHGPEVRERVWPALCAAAFAASAALALATAMIVAPPVTTTHVVQQAR